MVIYLDNAATTRVAPEVFEAMSPFLQDEYGNPSSVYALAGRSAAALEDGRRSLAEFIGAEPEEIIFVGSGSEADNLAIKGTMRKKDGGHMITSAIEHHAVLHTCKYLQEEGYDLTVAGVDQHGLVDPREVADAIREDTRLITIMHSNNEVGTIQPIVEIAAIARERGIKMHTDAVQSLGKVPLNVDALGVDMMSFSAHKLHGPKGVGALYIRKGFRPEPIIHGGGQERRLRAGTENVPGIVGFGRAVSLAAELGHEPVERMRALRDKLIAGVLEAIPETVLSGHPVERLPNIASFLFRYIEGEGILLSLDMKDIAGSSGSACTSGSLDPSHVLLSMGYPHEIAHGSLRLSLSRYTTEQEIDTVLEVLPPIIQRLRDMSPLYPRR
ncbi:MAG: cysteine desulfurase NifS [candidate division WS1 bacterium]|nr:cysteine desulfurase NifS [candidate division WS1 bacterium]